MDENMLKHKVNTMKIFILSETKRATATKAI